MILAIDIGNTNVKIALFKKTKLINVWRLSTDTKRTGDEYLAIIGNLFSTARINPVKIEKTVISSVVPALIGPFVNVAQSLTEKKPLVINSEIYSKLPISLPETAKAEIGTDLFCDALAAWEKYKCPCIITDFGTALSFIAVNQEGHIAGVAIAPGIRTAFNSLFNNTAQIPAIPLEIPETSLGKNTVVAVQSGIVLGYKGLVETLISNMKNDMEKEFGTNQKEIKVIATGGLNSMLQPITDVYDCVDKDLTLEGIYTIADLLA